MLRFDITFTRFITALIMLFIAISSNTFPPEISGPPYSLGIPIGSLPSIEIVLLQPLESCTGEPKLICSFSHHNDLFAFLVISPSTSNHPSTVHLVEIEMANLVHMGKATVVVAAAVDLDLDVHPRQLLVQIGSPYS